MARPSKKTGKKKVRSSDNEKPPRGPTVQDMPEPCPGGGGRQPPDTKPSPGLYLVATPIGNAADITLRALAVLTKADLVACEDTRVTSRLLAIHGIATPLVPYHEHNAEKARPALIKRLKKGQTVALVCNAGTPLVSDPGYKLVRACAAESLPVTALPGASSVLAALVLSGLPTDRFMFQGFLPVKAIARRQTLAALAATRTTLVLMESAKRLAVSLADMAEAFGNREASVCRELTKLFEEVRRGPLPVLATHYQKAGAPKGEVTVVVAPAGNEAAIDDDEIDRLLGQAMRESSTRDAAAMVAIATGQTRRRVYARALALKPDKQ
jgi:16S rRNA (cytidine1402-2'-O)-methyltransferase